jgi:WD40 repeat protein
VLASSAPNNALKLWDVASGRDLHTLLGHKFDVTSVAFSSNGDLVASGSWDKTVKVWEVRTGREICTLTGHTSDLAWVGFSPDGRLLASRGRDKTVLIWEVDTGREVETLGGHAYSVAFSPDGKTLAAAGIDRTLKLWELATGKELQTLDGHTGKVGFVTFSPDGHVLAMAGDNGPIKLWDVAGGGARTLAARTPMYRGMFSPDGRVLAAVQSTGSILLWDVATGAELAMLVRLDESDWAVVDPQGRFDASPGGMESMHWVVGNETLSLSQLKDRYFEPGLLAKVLGFNKEPLRQVSAFADVKLFPEVGYSPPAPGSSALQIRLKNRGGGLGRVQVFVNGKEVGNAVRGPRVDPHAAEATLSVDLSGTHFKPGCDRQLEAERRAR